MSGRFERGHVETYFEGVRCCASLCGWEAESDERSEALREAREHMQATGHRTDLMESTWTELRIPWSARTHRKEAGTDG